MVNYVYESESEKEYRIREVETEQIIKTGLTLEKAKKMKRFLNFGGGFNGYTPSFILLSAKTK